MMLILARKNTIFIIVLLVLIQLNFQYSYAIDKQKAKENIRTIKQIKLLELLKLNDATAEKLLQTIKSYDDKIEVANNDIKKTKDQLIIELKTVKNKDISKLKQLNNDVITKSTTLHKFMVERLESIKQILDDKSFAKFVIFESRFRDELRKHINNRILSKQNHK